MSRTAGQELGEQLERAVSAGCEMYLRQRVARIEKVPTPIKQLKRAGAGGEFLAVHERVAHTDFFGVWLSGPLAGKAIVIECKATFGDRLAYSVIEVQQRAWLDDTPEAYLLVEFASLRTVRLVRWADVQPRSSVKPTDGWPVAAVQFLAPLLADATNRAQSTAEPSAG